MLEMRTTGNKMLIELKKEDIEVKPQTRIHLWTKDESSNVINAKVISIGKDVKEVSVGDDVVCETMALQKFTVDFKEYCIVPEPSILGYQSENSVVRAINECN